MGTAQGSEDLSDEDAPGRPRDVGLDEILRHRIEMDAHATALKLAHSLGIPPQTVSHIYGTAGDRKPSIYLCLFIEFLTP
jgi:hypothetical protein